MRMTVNGVKKPTKPNRAATRYAIHSTAPTVCFLEPQVNSGALPNPRMSKPISLSDSKDDWRERTR